MASRSLITSESSRRRTQQKEGGRRTVERIAAFASNANPEHLDFEVRHTLKRNVLDSLGCAISALSGPPELFVNNSTNIGRRELAPSSAAEQLRRPGCALQFRSCPLCRPPRQLHVAGRSCHPSDNFGAVLAAAEHVHASGEQFLLALAVAYALEQAPPIMVHGLEIDPTSDADRSERNSAADQQ